MTAEERITVIDLPQEYALRKEAYDAAVQQVIASGFFVLGPQVAEVEARLSSYVGSGHCVACGNGTDAMILALEALGVGPGDEVITTPFTFFGTAEVIVKVGAKPVFVDIDPQTFNIDPAAVAAAVTPATRAILPVSLYGQMPDMIALQEVADAHGLPIIEDAAQSFGATQNGRHSCAASTMATTSFFPTKPLGCWGDGGAVFTADESLAATVRKLRHHGDSSRYEHDLVGWNSRLDSLQAAVLMVKLDHFADDLARRQAAAAYYEAHLADVCQVPHVVEGNTSAWAQYSVRVPQRDAVQAALREAGVPAAVHYPQPIYRQPSFVALGYGGLELPQVELACREVLCLPLHPLLTTTMQDRVIAALRAALKG